MSTENIDVSQISSENIRTSLVKFLKEYVKSQNIKVCIERGSEKGKQKVILLVEKVDT